MSGLQTHSPLEMVCRRPGCLQFLRTMTSIGLDTAQSSRTLVCGTGTPDPRVSPVGLQRKNVTQVPDRSGGAHVVSGVWPPGLASGGLIVA
jgi:hypothetical protein